MIDEGRWATLRKLRYCVYEQAHFPVVTASSTLAGTHSDASNTLASGNGMCGRAIVLCNLGTVPEVCNPPPRRHPCPLPTSASVEEREAETLFETI